MQKEMIDKRFFYSRSARHCVRYTFALITGLVGLADMLSAFVPKSSWITFLGTWSLETVNRLHAQTFTVVVGFFLIMLSYGLARGKMHAWFITILLLLLSAVLHVQRNGSVLSTVVALALAALLYTFSRFFHAKTDPPSAWR